MRPGWGSAALLALGLAGACWALGRRGEASDPVPAAPPRAGAHPGSGAPSAAPQPVTAGASPVLGEFRLAPDAVVDGDTFRLEPPKGSVRVQSVDAEEVFHDRRDREAAAADFPAYARAKRGDAPAPVKFGTPAGEEARDFARRLLAGVSTVRLEVDEPGLERDAYDRTLAHVFFVGRDGKEVLYAEALVRAGLSPYFVKYGRSRRFDARLAAAEAEARAAKRGIWGDSIPHYPDYTERLAWWQGRAAQVDAWLARSQGPPARLDLVRLAVPAERERLPGLLGRRVTVFGTLDREEGDETKGAAAHGPRRLMLVAAPHAAFPIVVFEGAVWDALDHEAIARRFLSVTGTLSEHRGRLQVILRAAEDLSTR